MKAPKQLKVTPKVWRAVKEDLNSKNYKKQSELMHRHGISLSTITNIGETDTYLEYLKKHAPSALKWYKSLKQEKKTPKIPKLTRDQEFIIETMAENVALHYVLCKVTEKARMFRRMTIILGIGMLLLTIINLFEIFYM